VPGRSHRSDLEFHPASPADPGHPAAIAIWRTATTFASLRWGEAMGLQRCDVDVAGGTVRIRQAFVEQRGVGLVLGPPKSRAGARIVALPRRSFPR
jgi:hypothetical protein